MSGTVGARERDEEHERLLACLESPFPAVRVHGARWAGREGLPSLVAPLVALLDDADPEVQVEAARALDGIGGRAEQAAEAARVRGEGGSGGAPPVLAGRARGPDPGPTRAPSRQETGPKSAPPRPRGPWDAEEGEGTPDAGHDDSRDLGAAPASGSSPPLRHGRELLLLVAVAGFLAGRNLRPPIEATAVPPAAATSLEELFPGGDPFSQIGRGAALARQGDPAGLPMILQGVDELLLPELAGSPRTRTAPLPVGEVDDAELVEDPWSGEGEAWPAEPGGPAPVLPPARSLPARMPGESPGPPPPTSRPSPVPPGPRGTRAPAPGPRGPPAASAVSAVERDMFLDAARRYLAGGDRARARELVLRVASGFPDHPEVRGMLEATRNRGP